MVRYEQETLTKIGYRANIMVRYEQETLTKIGYRANIMVRYEQETLTNMKIRLAYNKQNLAIIYYFAASHNIATHIGNINIKYLGRKTNFTIK